MNSPSEVNACYKKKVVNLRGRGYNLGHYNGDKQNVTGKILKTIWIPKT